MLFKLQAVLLGVEGQRCSDQANDFLVHQRLLQRGSRHGHFSAVRSDCCEQQLARGLPSL
jgi:hypothetical protein